MVNFSFEARIPIFYIHCLVKISYKEFLQGMLKGSHSFITDLKKNGAVTGRLCRPVWEDSQDNNPIAEKEADYIAGTSPGEAAFVFMH